jgi:hypothetical protein
MIHALLLAAMLAVSPHAAAAGSPEAMTVSIMPGWRQADGVHVAALHVRLAPGWKTYWRQPGSLGIPPRFDWAGSKNVAAIRAEWPVPEVFRQQGGQAIGYVDDVVLPILVRPERAWGPIRLRGRLSMGVCAEICVPVSLRLSAELPAGGAPDRVIQAALSDRAERGHFAVRCRLTPAGRGGAALHVELRLPRLGPAEAVAIEVPDPALWIADTRTSRDGRTLRAWAEIVAADGRAIGLDRSRMVFTVIGGGRAVETTGCAG